MPLQQILDELSEDRTWRHLTHITEQIPSRLAGTPNARQMAEYAAEQLADAVRSGPLDIDVEFPFHPHVTVAHHLTEDQLDSAFADLADFECLFEVSSFHLYVHDAAEGWRPTRGFALLRGPGDD